MDQVPNEKDQEYEEQYWKQLVQVARWIVGADIGFAVPFVGLGGQDGNDAVDAALDTAGIIVCLDWIPPE
jgi:hypothetical protein